MTAARHWKRGDIVQYEAIAGHWFGAVVSSERPFLVGAETLSVTLHALGPEYRSYTGKPAWRTSVTTPLERVRVAPTELVNGVWVVSDDWEADAVISYATEGNVTGWLWWAHGVVETAYSYESAKLAAERELESRRDRQHTCSNR